MGVGVLIMVEKLNLGPPKPQNVNRLEESRRYEYVVMIMSPTLSL